MLLKDLLYCAFSFAACLANFSAVLRDKLQERSCCLVKRAIFWSSVTSHELKHFSQHLHRSILRAAFSTTFKTLRDKFISGSVSLECESGVRTLLRSNSLGRKNPLRGTPYIGLYGEAPHVRVTFFKQHFTF